MLHWMVAISIVSQACCVEAALVTFRLAIDEHGAGSFNLYASSSPEDNFGLAFYSVRLSGGITSLDHHSPHATDLATGASVGFRTLRSVDNDPLLLVEAAQDTITPSPFLVRRFGQSSGSLSSLPGISQLITPEQPDYTGALLLATGRYVGPSDAIGFAGGALANVFRTSAGLGTLPAIVTTQVTRLPACLTAHSNSYASSALTASPSDTVPEPNSGLAGTAMAWIALHARRRLRRTKQSLLPTILCDLTDNCASAVHSGGKRTR